MKTGVRRKPEQARDKRKVTEVTRIMWFTIITLVYLLILGIKDTKDRKIPTLWLAVGAVLLAGMGICRCLQGELAWMDILMGCVQGALLLVVAKVTGKAGYADGIVLIELGLCLGYRESAMIFCFSLFLLAICSIILLLFRKVRRDTRMPYLPFLAVVFLMRQI